MKQGRLFAGLTAQIAGLTASTKSAMRQALDDSGISREQLLDKMNGIAQAAGVKLTGGNSRALNIATLDKWLNPAELKHHPGIVALNTFCAALENPRPLTPQLTIHDCELMDEEGRLARDYGRACLAAKEAGKLKRQLEAKF